MTGVQTCALPIFAPWQAGLSEKEGRHWREDLPFTFDAPAGWTEAPALVRSLALLDAWVRSDKTSAPWLGFPVMLARMGLTTRPLPCLVLGDPGQRFAVGPRPALLKRLFRQLRRAAEDRRTIVASLRKYETQAGLLAEKADIKDKGEALALKKTIANAADSLEKVTRESTTMDGRLQGDCQSLLLKITPALGK